MKSGVTKALEDSAEKLDKTLVDDAGKAVSGLYGKTHEGLTTTLENHAKNEAEREAELKAIKDAAKTKEALREDLGPTPVYRIRDDGTVEKLTKTGPKKLEQEDLDRLPLKLDSEHKILEPEGADDAYKLPPTAEGQTHPKSASQQVPFGHDELSRATQLARHEAKSYGGYREIKKAGKKTGDYKFSSNNYAALRYGEEGDKNGFILVARSQYLGAHSEPALGIPLLESKSAQGITALYTEREPCSVYPNCSAWMHHYLPDHVKISHSVEYGETPDSRKAGNQLMEHYLNALRMPKPFKRYTG
ncbi:nucleic acid/nucleotide deaminase domain-containing protein [Kitasatospora sp. GAS1066B]|uniref:nucleic acid/nucleotide deaminase domain-containing protein n=1 Tax=Kitasatospora sp. GAS1066B TaxID=3156271 RepID=UPI0035123882